MNGGSQNKGILKLADSNPETEKSLVQVHNGDEVCHIPVEDIEEIKLAILH